MIDQLSPAHRALRDAVALAQNEPNRAIGMLSTALVAARKTGTVGDVAALAKHAGAICHGEGDLAAAARFYREAVVAAPNDAHVHLALGGVLRDLGHTDDARQSLLECLAGATKLADDDLVAAASKLLASL